MSGWPWLWEKIGGCWKAGSGSGTEESQSSTFCSPDVSNIARGFAVASAVRVLMLHSRQATQLFGFAHAPLGSMLGPLCSMQPGQAQEVPQPHIGGDADAGEIWKPAFSVPKDQVSKGEGELGAALTTCCKPEALPSPKEV